MHKSNDEWKKVLSPEQYAVLREHATEQPFSGALLKNSATGTYVCGACHAPLFTSDTKFDSGTGWPSFYDVVDKGAVKLVPDHTLGIARTEVVCANCESHLGHLFADAYDQPTGQRFCINSAALDFKPSEQK